MKLGGTVEPAGMHVALGDDVAAIQNHEVGENALAEGRGRGERRDRPIHDSFPAHRRNRRRAEQAMALIVDTTAAFFRIREHTRNEFVSVGGNGNVLRWAETGEDAQEWLFLPMGERTYRIMTKTNGEYMAVGSDGNVVRWAYVDDKSQLFKLVNEDSSGAELNIQESTRDEFVAVGSNGNVLRWAKSNDNDQRFTLEPRNAAAKPDLPAVEAEPGQIGDVPRLTSLDFTSLPERSEARVVGAALVPATMVRDPSYSDPIEQMKRNPYYISVRRQHWSREAGHGYAYGHAAGETTEFTERVVYEVTSRDTRTSEATWGLTFSIKGEMAASTKDKEGIGKTSSRGMALEISHQLKTTLTQESEIRQLNEQTVSRTYDASHPAFSIVGWSLVDTYTLYKGDGTTVVSEVQAGYDGSLRKDAWPSEEFNPVTL